MKQTTLKDRYFLTRNYIENEDFQKEYYGIISLPIKVQKKIIKAAKYLLMERDFFKITLSDIYFKSFDIFDCPEEISSVIIKILEEKKDDNAEITKEEFDHLDNEEIKDDLDHCYLNVFAKRFNKLCYVGINAYGYTNMMISIRIESSEISVLEYLKTKIKL